MSTTLITSRDPKGRQATSIFEAAYNKAKLDDDAAQLLNERGDELKAGVSDLIAKLSVTNQYADEEVSSSYGYLSVTDKYKNEEVASKCGYLSDYKPKKLTEQAITLRRLFPELVGCNYVLGARTLPSGAEGWFAIPRWQSIAPTYGEAVQKVLDLLEKAYGGKFDNYCKGPLGPANLRQSAKSVAFWEKIGEEQKGFDILLIPAQFGIRHRGRSVRRAREVMESNECGLGAFAVGIMLLTHEDRLQHYDDLWIDCAGDEFHDPRISGEPFDHAPIFYFVNGELRFDTFWSVIAIDHYGSASGWSVPQE